MNTYSIKFEGRLLHAIGITYTIREIVQAEDKDKAILKLYEKYDCVHFPKVKLIKEGA